MRSGESFPEGFLSSVYVEFPFLRSQVKLGPATTARKGRNTAGYVGIFHKLCRTGPTQALLRG